MAFSKTQIFYSFLLINFAVKVCGLLNLLTYEQKMTKGFVKVEKTFRKIQRALFYITKGMQLQKGLIRNI